MMTNDSIKYNENGGESQLGTQVTEPDSEMTQVGYEFVPGVQGNVEIDRGLGHDTMEFNGLACRRASSSETEINWLAREEYAAPDYCADDALTLEILDDQYGVQVFVWETEDTRPAVKGVKRAKFVPEFMAVFDLEDTLYCTATFKVESHASACALWYTLGHISHK